MTLHTAFATKTVLPLLRASTDVWPLVLVALPTSTRTSERVFATRIDSQVQVQSIQTIPSPTLSLCNAFEPTACDVFFSSRLVTCVTEEHMPTDLGLFHQQIVMSRQSGAYRVLA